ALATAPPPSCCTLSPYTTPSRSLPMGSMAYGMGGGGIAEQPGEDTTLTEPMQTEEITAPPETAPPPVEEKITVQPLIFGVREDKSEEHTSELQSRENLVCRLLLE